MSFKAWKSKFVFCVFLGLYFLAHRAMAQDTGNTEKPFQARRRGGAKAFRVGDDKSPAAGSIHGKCIMVESESNPFAGPCVESVLILNDSSGNEVLRSRTSANGAFTFAAQAGERYFIVAAAKGLELISPKGPVQAGQGVEVRLKSK